MNGLFKLNEDGGFGPAMMFAVPGPGPDKDTKGIPSDPSKEKGIEIKDMKKLPTFRKFRKEIEECLDEARVNDIKFSIHDKKPGDVVEIEGKPVKITKFLSWVKDRDAHCTKFNGEIAGNEVVINYDDDKDEYIIK